MPVKVEGKPTLSALSSLSYRKWLSKTHSIATCPNTDWQILIYLKGFTANYNLGHQVYCLTSTVYHNVVVSIWFIFVNAHCTHKFRLCVGSTSLIFNGRRIISLPEAQKNLQVGQLSESLIMRIRRNVVANVSWVEQSDQFCYACQPTRVVVNKHW